MVMNLLAPVAGAEYYDYHLVAIWANGEKATQNEAADQKLGGPRQPT